MNWNDDKHTDLECESRNCSELDVIRLKLPKRYLRKNLNTCSSAIHKPR